MDVFGYIGDITVSSAPVQREPRRFQTVTKLTRVGHTVANVEKACARIGAPRPNYRDRPSANFDKLPIRIRRRRDLRYRKSRMANALSVL